MNQASFPRTSLFTVIIYFFKSGNSLLNHNDNDEVFADQFVSKIVEQKEVYSDPGFDIQESVKKL